jgi:aspartate/methionine/tyrosine aminotransferase
MDFPISPNIERVHFPPISEVREWLAGRSFPPELPLVDLCQAIPDYPPAPALIEYLKSILQDPQLSRYSPDEGLPTVREAVAAWYRRHYGAGPAPDQICLTVGASQAFWLALMVLCRAGDEVILQAPAYFDHPMALQALGLSALYAPFDPAAGGLPEIDTLARMVTPRTRALLLVTPSNPTGAIIPPDTVRRLFAFCQERRIALVLDETYNAFVDGPPHQLFRDPVWPDQFVHLASFGKTFALTGYRPGALVASAPFIRHALKVQDTMAVCQPRITQHAVQFGCEQLDDWVAANRLMMQRRHDRFRDEFLAHGEPFELVASGSFFAWVRHPFAGESGRAVARRLAQQAHLICLPGEVFGPGLEGYLRLAIGNLAAAAIPAAVRRLRAVRP